MHEFRILLTAVQFYTILPMPAFEFRAGYFQRILRYASLVGLAIGGIGALAFMAAHAALPLKVAVSLSLTATAVATGCFHEDGFADLCDGLGAGGGRSAKLAAMRDSRLSHAGLIGAIFALLVRFAALATLPANLIPIALLTGHSISRFASAIYAYDLEYARNEITAAPASGAKPIVTDVRATDLIVSGLVASFAGAIACVADPRGALIVPALVAAYIVFRSVLIRSLGGYTGDCLGAAQQIFETTVYLVFAAIAAASTSAI